MSICVLANDGASRRTICGKIIDFNELAIHSIRTLFVSDGTVGSSGLLCAGCRDKIVDVLYRASYGVSATVSNKEQYKDVQVAAVLERQSGWYTLIPNEVHKTIVCSTHVKDMNNRGFITIQMSEFTDMPSVSRAEAPMGIIARVMTVDPATGKTYRFASSNVINYQKPNFKLTFDFYCGEWVNVANYGSRLPPSWLLQVEPMDDNPYMYYAAAHLVP